MSKSPQKGRMGNSVNGPTFLRSFLNILSKHSMILGVELGLHGNKSSSENTVTRCSCGRVRSTMEVRWILGFTIWLKHNIEA